MAASSTTKTPIFIVGATGKSAHLKLPPSLRLSGSSPPRPRLPYKGYIGGAVLSRLIQHPNAESFQISAIIRNSDKAQILQSKFGVSAVVGTFQDLDKIESLAESAHIVFNIVRSPSQVLPKGLTVVYTLGGCRRCGAYYGHLERSSQTTRGFG